MQKQIDSTGRAAKTTLQQERVVQKRVKQQRAVHVDSGLLTWYCLKREELSRDELEEVEGHLRICELCRKEAETGADDYFKGLPPPCD